MGEGFLPYRRDVSWQACGPVLLTDLKERLVFTRAPNWGYRLRQGLVEIGADDMDTIARAMITAAARLDLQAA